MPKLGPVKHKQLIKYLRKLGFDGPYSYGRSPHSVMHRSDQTLTIPNKHGSGELEVNLLKKVLKQAGIDVNTWEKL